MSKLKRLWAWLHTHRGRIVVRFTSVSVISTIVSYSVIFLLYGTKLVSNEVWATVLGNVFATFPSYWLNRTWTWGKRGRSHLQKEVVPFWAMSLLGIAVSVAGAVLARHLIHTHHWGHLFNTFVLSSFNIVSFAVFWVLKLWLFNRIFGVDTFRSMDEHLSQEERAESH